MNFETAYQLTIILTGINLIISSLEYIAIKDTYAEDGIWTKDIWEKDLVLFPSLIKKIYSYLFHHQVFFLIVFLRLVAALTLLIFNHWLIIAFLFFSTVIISQKFRGAFNGGSDYMTILTLFSLLLFEIFQHSPFVFYYLVIQVILSYFLAGVVKLKSNEWRTGIAVKNLAESPNYAPWKWVEKIFSHKKMSFVFGWAIIILELIFPFLIFTVNLKLIFLSCLIFHVFNFIFFGLNRFVFAWIATYPLVIYILKFKTA